MIQHLLNKIGTEDAEFNGEFDESCGKDATFYIDGGGLRLLPCQHWTFWINALRLENNSILYIKDNDWGDLRANRVDESILYRINIQDEEERNQLVEYLLNTRFILSNEEVDHVLAVMKLESL